MKTFTKLFFGLALTPVIFWVNAFGQNSVMSFSVENGTYFPGDPVMMSVTVQNTADVPGGEADYWLDVHLTPGPPSENFRQSRDHMLQTFSGSLYAGQSHEYEWVQFMPGNLTGEFYVTFEIYGDIGPISPAITHSSSVNIVLQSEGMGRFPTTSLLSRGFGSPNIADEEFDFNVSDGVFNTDGNSENPSVSADGRFVVFASTATNLSPPIVDAEGEVIGAPSPNVVDIFLQDRNDGSVTLVSKPAAVLEFSNGNSLNPKISPDGRFVVFHSTATNLVSGPVNAHSDVYVFDRLSGDLRRISMGANGGAANGPSFNASVSDPDPESGHRFVAFESEASNLLPPGQDTNNFADIYLYNLNTGAVRRVNVTDGGSQAIGGHSRNPVISGDAGHIAFQSRATNLGSTTANWDVFVHDRRSNRTVPMSVGFDMAGGSFPADGHSYTPAITPDGRYVAFASEALNLFNSPATGSVTLSGRPEQAIITFPETLPATGLLSFNPDVNATGAIEFLENPIPNEVERRTITIDDGVNSVTWEFANSVAQGYQLGEGNVRLVVGSNREATRNRLRDAINASPLTISAAAAMSEGESPNPLILLENTAQGEAGNQPIQTTNLDGVIGFEGMDGATTTNVTAGDQLIIETRPGLESVFTFVTGEPQTPNEIQIAGTARGTRDNIANAIQNLMALDLPNISNPTTGGTFLVGPLAENPSVGEFYIFQHQGTTQVFQFVGAGIQFDPEIGLSPDAIPVIVGPSLEVTRGNLIRYLNALFEFDDFPEGIGDTPATGTISLRVNPDPEVGANIAIGPVNFVFVEEFEEDEDDPDFDFEEEVIDLRDPATVLIVIGEDVEESRERLLLAIQGSVLNLTAAEGTDEDGEPAITLLYNEVGPQGNLEFAFAPIPPEPDPDDPDEEEEPVTWVTFPDEGMEGGELVSVEPGTTQVLYEHGLLKSAITLEFSPDGMVGSNNLWVPSSESGDDTLGNLLQRVRGLNLPWVSASTIDGNGSELLISNLTPGGVDTIVLNIDFTGDPGIFQEFPIPTQEGEFHLPRDGAVLSFNDTANTATFEFIQEGMGAGPGVIGVPVGQSAADTRDYLIRAILESNLNVTVLDTTTDQPAVRIVNNRRGAIPDPNHVFVVAENFPEGVIVELLEGRDNPVPGESFSLSDGSSVVTFEFVEEAGDESPGNVPVVLGPDEQVSITFENLVDAIRDTNLQIAVVPGIQGGAPSVSLTNWTPGPVGNVAITTVPSVIPSFQVSGMSGGGFQGNGLPQIYVHDRDANETGVYDEAVPGGFVTEAISLTPLETFSSFGSLEPAISADGRYVSFRTPGAGTDLEFDFDFDFDEDGNIILPPGLFSTTGLQPLTVERSDGVIFPNVYGPVLTTAIGGPIETTDDDNPIVFSQEIVLQDRIQNFTESGITSRIYVRDRETNINERVSVNRFGEGPGFGQFDSGTLNVPSSSRNAVMSADGRYVIFVSDNGPFTFRTAPAPQPNAGDGGFRGGALSAGITNRNPLNNNGFRNIFIHDRNFPTDIDQPEPTFPPFVNLINPVDGAQLSLGVAHQLRASAFANTGHGGAVIESVEFLINGSVEATVGATPYAINWQPDQVGTYSIVARARDNRGEVASSRVATVTVSQIDPVARDSDFVRRGYASLLGRQPTELELQQANSRLASGAISRQRFIADLMDSQDFEEVLVNAYSAYRVILGRPPTDAEMQEAVGMIRMFEGVDDDDDVDLPDDIPDGLIVANVARVLGLIQLTESLLTSAEFVGRFGGVYLAGLNREYIEFLFSNFGRSPSNIDLVRGNLLIEGGEGVEELGRLNYAVALIGGLLFVDEANPQSSVTIRIPGSVRENHRRVAMYYGLTQEIPDAATRSRLHSGSRTDAVGVTLGSPAYINSIRTFFGSVVQVERHTKESDWLGQYDDRQFDYGTHSGWIRHSEHGWWYRPSNDTDWTYDQILRSWVWTNPSVYPFMYLDSEQTWLFYYEGGNPDSRWFFNYKVDEWQQVD